MSQPYTSRFEQQAPRDPRSNSINSQNDIINANKNPVRYDFSPVDTKNIEMIDAKFYKRKSTSRSRQNGVQKPIYSTQNFLNQTMAQIVQGKDRELFPLVNK
jgi:hypothetical protein